MKLWFVWQDQNNGYDTYDSAVVAAETEDDAKAVKLSDFAGTWVAPEFVRVKLIGIANEGIVPGVICASFNAG